MALRVLSLVVTALLVVMVGVTAANRGAAAAAGAGSAAAASGGSAAAAGGGSAAAASGGSAAAASSGRWAPRNDATSIIIDGIPAIVGQFPHQAYILAERVNDSRTYICSGSLINKYAVLTNAHCVKNYQKWTIRLGGIRRSTYEETAWTTVSPWALLHPEYEEIPSYANLAIIYLVHDAPLSGYIMPVPLPSSLEANTTYLLQRAFITSWRFTTLAEHPAGHYEEILHWTEVTVVPIAICKPFYPSGYDFSDKLCAANENVGGSWGDGGTGLHLTTEYGFKLIGILADFGGNASAGSRPTVYTRVASYSDWILINASTNNKAKTY